MSRPALQSYHWARFFTLLNTSNFHAGLVPRSRALFRKEISVNDLTATHIVHATEQAVEWKSRRCFLEEICSMVVPPCVVGVKGTLLSAVFLELAVMLRQVNMHASVQCEMTKKETDFYMVLMGFDYGRDAMMKRLRNLPCMKESEALIEPLGPTKDMITLQWFIPLTRRY